MASSSRPGKETRTVDSAAPGGRILSCHYEALSPSCDLGPGTSIRTMLGPNSWRRPTRSGSPSAQPHRDRSRSRSRSRSRDRHAPRANELGEAHCRRSDHDWAHADERGRPDRVREEDRKRSASDYTDHCARPSSLSHWRAGDDSDRRPDVRRAGDDDRHRERRHDERRAYASQRRSDSLADSRRRDEGCSEPRRDRQGFASRQQDCHTIGHD